MGLKSFMSTTSASCRNSGASSSLIPQHRGSRGSAGPMVKARAGTLETATTWTPLFRRTCLPCSKAIGRIHQYRLDRERLPFFGQITCWDLRRWHCSSQPSSPTRNGRTFLWLWPSRLTLCQVPWHPGSHGRRRERSWYWLRLRKR